jgi:hypothetical protein
VTVPGLILSLSLHWALLQTLAWTGMILKYSRNASFPVAIAKTFDGRHPCALCKTIQQGRAEQKKQDQQQVKPTPKLDLGLVWQATDLHFACDPTTPFSSLFSAHSRTDQPPQPRPRVTSQGNGADA